MKKQFIDYCLSFYGDGGVYPFQFNRDEIEKGLYIRLRNKTFPFEGDSIDREMVRDIVFELREVAA